ncbi:MAG TPA: DUF6343 family protein [Jatrophihabitans sp.]|jgi:hypothetical protein|nr:DUF6343 family protein [Jatrophihabitans sp.]
MNHRQDQGDRAGARAAKREQYARGLPDYHDPLSGIAGAPPARSALTARLVLAIIGVTMAAGGAIVLALASAPVGFVVLMCVLGAVLLVDIVVLARRKLRGEPG